MSITYRSVKGSELEHAEVDENFKYLDEKSDEYVVGHVFRGPVLRIHSNQIYRLVDTVSFPFTATDFATELANGDWVLAGSSGGGSTPSLQDVTNVDSTTSNTITVAGTDNLGNSVESRLGKRYFAVNKTSNVNSDTLDVLVEADADASWNLWLKFLKTIGGVSSTVKIGISNIVGKVLTFELPNKANGTYTLATTDDVQNNRFFCTWKLGGAMAASTSWYAQGALSGLRGSFTTNASLTPSNAFANHSILTPAFVLPFQAKIKSITVKGWCNGTTSATVRLCVVRSNISVTSGSTIQNSVIIGDVSFLLNDPFVNGFHKQFTTTGLTGTTQSSETEIRAFLFNDNNNTPLQDAIILVEFEKVA